MPLYLTEFKDGNEMLVALTIVMNIIGETPMLFLAKYIIDRFGYVRCLYMASLAFSLRFIMFLFTLACNVSLKNMQPCFWVFDQ